MEFTILSLNWITISTVIGALFLFIRRWRIKRKIYNDNSDISEAEKSLLDQLVATKKDVESKQDHFEGDEPEQIFEQSEHFGRKEEVLDEKQTSDIVGETIGQSNLSYIRSLVPVLISLILLASALYIILSQKFADADSKWAYGTIGSIVGYWMKT